VTGSYRVAFSLSIFFHACGSVAFWMLRRPAAEERIVDRRGFARHYFKHHARY
jgi:hypothetical protein